MPLVALAFPTVVSSTRAVPPAAADPPGLLLESAAEALAPLFAETSGRVVIVVPSVWFVAPFKQALRTRCARPGTSWIPPAVDTLAGHAAAADPAGIAGVARSRYARLLAMANRLAGGGAADVAGANARETDDANERRAAGWPGRFQRAGGLLDLVDAIDAGRAIEALAAGAAPAAGMADYLQSLAAAVTGSQDALLVSDLRLLAALAEDVAAADDPLAVQARQWTALLERWQASKTTVVRIGMRPLQPLRAGAAHIVDDRHDRVLAAFLARGPSLRILDLHPAPHALAQAAPLLCAAWPEVQAEPAGEAQGATTGTPIGARRLLSSIDPAERKRAAAAILHARTREEEAALAAQWVHGRLAAGAQSLAILVMDRWLARRTRALLERSRILIDDREGWALSTTVAASLVMAWLDHCALPDERPHPGPRSALALTTLLDAAFTTEPAAPALVAAIRRAQQGRGRRGGPGEGAQDGGGPHQAAAQLENRLAVLAARQRRCARIGDHLECLRSVLGVLGAMTSLQQDEAGRQVLALLDGLPAQAGAGCRLDQFRALLGFALEGQRFHDGSIDSPVRMIGPGPAVAARYDAVLVLGANDGKLPAAPAPPPGIIEPMLPLLGLRPIAQQALAQTCELAWVLAGAADWAMTCRSESSDGSLPSQLVERLAAVADLDLATAHRRVAPRLLPSQDPAAAHEPWLAGDRWPMPRPAAAVTRMPQEVSVGSFERLVACPYEFLVADVWRLADVEEPVEAPGKRELGNVVHAVLLRFHEEVETPYDDDGAMIDLLSSLTRDVVAASPSLRSSRLVHLQEWYAQMPGYVRQFREDHASGWRFLDGEKAVCGVIDFPVAGLDTPARLRVRGKYDRLDQRAEALRVLDYKLQDQTRIGKRAKDPDQAAQLMLYSWFVEAGQAGYLAIDRKGTKLAALDPPPQQALPQWQARVETYLGRIADGEPLRALGRHCDRCRARGVCRQGHWRDE